MLPRLTTFVCLLAMSLPGCSEVVSDLMRKSVKEPRLFNATKAGRRDTKAFESLAQAAWHDWQSGFEKSFSETFIRGFEEGYVDYLRYGGDGEPPPLPPRDFWSATCDWDQRSLVVSDWYRGFRAGAQESAASGLREKIVVPTANAVWSISDGGYGSELIPVPELAPVEILELDSD